MTKLLLSVHVLAAILAVGSITVAASMFPRYALRALTPEGDRAAGIAALLHRVCRGYAVAGLAVPVFGIATAARLGVLGDAWLIASLILTALAAGLLAAAVLPGQRRLLEAGGESARPLASRLTMVTGVFNLLWATVTVLMIVRPGSTTGA
ncbi:hypothetical protein SALBM135S_00132 [Streptomyces alboniger]